MWRFAGLYLIASCSLYFDEPTQHHISDAGLVAFDGGSILPSVDAAPTCPAPGVSASIAYPLDGAIDVAQPVPIQNIVYRPLAVDDGVGIYLSDATGQTVSLDHYDGSCSTQIPPMPTNPEQWIECYDGLGSGSAYTWHIWITCYDATGIHEIATSTFTTAP